MAVKIKCPNPECQQVLQVSEELAGKKGKCSHCSTTFLIPQVKKSPPQAASSNAPPPQAAPPRPAQQRPAQRRPAPQQAPQMFDFGGSSAGYAPPPQPGYDQGLDFVDDPYAGGAAYGDPYAGSGGYPAQSGQRRRSGGSWKWTKVGFLISSIGAFLFAFSLVLLIVCGLVFTISVTAGSISSGSQTTVRVLLKIAYPFQLAGIAAMATGFCFQIANIGRAAIMSFGIVISVLGITDLILQIIFRVVPAFAERSALYDRLVLSLIGTTTTGRVMTMLWDVMLVGALVVLALLIMKVGTSSKIREIRDGGFRGLIFACVFGGLSLAVFITAMIMFSSRPTTPGGAKAMVWVMTIMSTISYVMLGLTLVFQGLAMLAGFKRLR